MITRFLDYIPYHLGAFLTSLGFLIYSDRWCMEFISCDNIENFVDFRYTLAKCSGVFSLEG